MGSTLILRNLVGVHPRNIHTNLKQFRAVVREKRSKNKTRPAAYQTGNESTASIQTHDDMSTDLKAVLQLYLLHNS